MTDSVRDNAAAGRFELEIGGQLAFASYRRDGATLIIPHVEAAPALRGTGAASRLMRGVAEHARREGMTIRPLCPYAASWFDHNADFQDVLA